MKKTKGCIPKGLRIFKKVFIFLFIFQFIYIILLKWVNPPITITQFSSWISGEGLKRDYVDDNDISYNIKLAVIASEDQLFPDHAGFDWKNIKKAIDYNKKKPGRVRGASTISQQVAKNVFLWQGGSWIRKAMEAYFTKMIEWVWGKERILEVYLNIIEMGAGIYGVEAASRSYFNKSAAKLTRKEAALIASCLPNPVKYKVKPLSTYVQRKHRWVLVQMRNIEPDKQLQEIIH